MNRWKTGVLAAWILAGLTLAPAAWAHEGPQDKGGHHDWIARRWKDKLGLSDEQVTKLQAAIKSSREAVVPLRRELKDGVEKLRAQLTLKQSEADIKATLDQIAKTRKALAAEREKVKSTFDSVLSVQQRAKLVVLFEGRRHEWAHGRGRPEDHEHAWRHHRHGEDDDKKGASVKPGDAPQGADQPAEEGSDQ